jgi:hypothetical protein
MALRCLAGALEIQGYDWGQFANQQYWTEDTTRATEVVFPGTVADERLGFSPGVAVAAVAEVDCVLPGSSVGPVVVVEGCFNLCDESVGEHDRAAWAAVPVDTQAAVFAEFFDCEEELVQIAAPLVAAGPDIFAEVGKDVLALGCADADAGADAAWVPGLGLFTIPGVIAEVGNDVTAAGCKEADAGADAAWGRGFGRLPIPGIVAEVGNDVLDAGCMEAAYGPGFGRPTITAVDAERSDDVLRDLLDLREAVLAAQDVPGRSKQQCFAAVRSAIARSTEISDLSPVAAAVLAEIQTHIGRPPSVL